MGPDRGASPPTLRRRRVPGAGLPDPKKDKENQELDEKYGDGEKRRILSPIKRLQTSPRNSAVRESQGNARLYVLMAGIVLFTPLILLRGPIRHFPQPTRPSLRKFDDLNVALPHSLRPPGTKEPPFQTVRTPLPTYDGHEDEEYDEEVEDVHPADPDYGEIEFWSLAEENQHIFARRLDPEDFLDYEDYKRELLEIMDEESRDMINPKYHTADDIEDRGFSCRRNNWMEDKYPTCNSIHELTVERPPSESQEFELSYLGRGFYRDAWLFDAHHVEDFVYKRLRLKDEFDMNYWDMHKIHLEAIIMERLTASPRIIGILGYCSTTILSETMGGEVSQDIIPGTGRVDQETLDQEDDVIPRNNFTAEEKLDMAIEMAEAVADMHGYEGGVIVHGDIHPVQWLLSKDGRLVLNDFNNGEILNWDTNKEHYCGTFRRFGGFYRAPEEYTGSLIDEGIDTFALGNNFYCLLTGLWPFYPWTSYGYIQDKLLNHERAYVDPRWRTRSFIEGRLVEIMERTWEHAPAERVSVFEVVQFLLDTKKEYKTQQVKH